MNKQKIFNDPVYGFISVPHGLLLDLIDHPWFQRLRRIGQLGLSHYVYPGALHTRFHHALGALHLTIQTIDVLRSKGVDINEQEAEAVCIAILLHDIGHGPFSHSLEHVLVDIHHEDISILLMHRLNEKFEGKLDLAIQIFKDEYPKKFLHQLVSGQLDMDRLDYLTRDSFYTGVSEGVVGYNRIIKMLHVVDNALVVEEKGIYSIENFLMARRLMYWQVYLHKTALVAEQMLIRAINRAKQQIATGESFGISEQLKYFLENKYSKKKIVTNSDILLDNFVGLDDYDIIFALKLFANSKDYILSFLSKSLLERKLFKIEMQSVPFEENYVKRIVDKNFITNKVNIDDISYLIFTGKEQNRAYSKQRDEIKILLKSGAIKPMSESSDYELNSKIIIKHYICYPKNIY